LAVPVRRFPRQNPNLDDWKRKHVTEILSASGCIRAIKMVFAFEN
jgi:hypothetical protein